MTVRRLPGGIRWAPEGLVMAAEYGPRKGPDGGKSRPSGRLVDLYRSPDIGIRTNDPRVTLPEIEFDFSVDIGGKLHSLNVRRLCPPRSITVKFDFHFLCDCHDLTLRPVTYRPHMYTGSSGKVSFDEKRNRMQKFQEALLVFDAGMTAVPTDSLPQVKQTLAAMQLPRAELVALSTGIPTLRKLYIGMGAVERGELLLEWDRLIEFARRGELLNRWLDLKRAT